MLGILHSKSTPFRVSEGVVRIAASSLIFVALLAGTMVPVVAKECPAPGMVLKMIERPDSWS